MSDRQFLRLMAIVVATGLALGLVAFRASRGAPPDAVGPRGPAAVAAAASSDSDTQPGSGDGDGDGDAVADGSSAVATSRAMEPPTPTADPPPMRGAVNLDPPGAAVVNEPHGAPAAGDPATSGSQP